MSSINNLFVLVHKKTEGALTIIVFLASITMFLIGVNLFAEDTYTSYMGLQAYQATFGLTLNAWPITFWSESLLPQVGQVVFFYIFFSDMRKNWWAAMIALGLLCVDFYADIYYRTGGVLSLNEGMELRRTIAGGVVTLFYFTIGAELFISIGFGLAMTTMAPAIKNFKQLFNEQKFALGNQQPRRSQPSRQSQPSQRDMEALLSQRNQRGRQ